jgi:hypothetical protein
MRLGAGAKRSAFIVCNGKEMSLRVTCMTFLHA